MKFVKAYIIIIHKQADNANENELFDQLALFWTFQGRFGIILIMTTITRNGVDFLNIRDILMFSDYMQELNILSIFTRLFLAVLSGAILGLDRSRKNRPAGFRTHMLVCMGAALVMLTNQYITTVFNVSDPARLGAQVISGIGFLGAGTIIVTRSNQVLGLTTAAGLWASACIGLAIGIGFYSAALIAQFFILFIVIFMHRLDEWLHSRSRVMEIYTELLEVSCLSAFLSYLHGQGIKASHVELVNPHSASDNIAAIISLKLPRRFNHGEVVIELQKAEGIVFLEEV